MVVAPVGVQTILPFPLLWHPTSTAPTNAAHATMPIARQRRREGATNPNVNITSMPNPAREAKVHARADNDAANAKVGFARGPFGAKKSMAFAFPGQEPPVGGSAGTIADEVTNTTEKGAGVPGVTLTGHGVNAQVVSGGSVTGQPNDTCSPCAPKVPSETTWPLNVADPPGITVTSTGCPGAS